MLKSSPEGATLTDKPPSPHPHHTHCQLCFVLAEHFFPPKALFFGNRIFVNTQPLKIYTQSEQQDKTKKTLVAAWTKDKSVRLFIIESPGSDGS